jgi:predicted MFS family arabinose efflux permease
VAILGFLRGLVPRLPRGVWLLEGAGLISTTGNGFVLPFLVIYLHEVRHFSLPTSGVVVSLIGAASVVVGPAVGARIDRLDTRVTAGSAMLLAAGAVAAFPLVRKPWEAFVLAAALGAAQGAFRPSESTLLSAIVPAPRRHTIFALQRVTQNLGIGIGAAIGGLVVSTTHPHTFTVVFLADAATFLPYLPAVAALPRVRRPEREPAESRRSYRYVFRDRAFVALISIDAALVIAGDSQFSSIFPVFAKEHAGVSERTIGLIFLVNTTCIVLFQMPVAKLIEGRRRMYSLAVACTVWALVWLLVLATETIGTMAAAALVLMVAAAAFAVGECLDGVVERPLVADLAPPPIRGRYFAVHSSASQLGFTVGPALGGFALAQSPEALWSLAASVCAAAGVAALLLEPRLPRSVRLTPRPEAAVEEEEVERPDALTVV